jgi:O-acetylserine/cysteine efflux transporter
VHLGLLYTGLQTAPASGASIISQSLIPLASILSVFWLKERIGWRRIFAIMGALIGVAVMIYEPGALRLDIGLLYILGAYAALAVGTVAIRRVPDVDWRIYVAWTAVVVLVFCSIMSLSIESDHAEIWRVDKAPLLIAATYAAISVSIIAHGQYFRILQSNPVNLVVPLTIMVTVFATTLGVLLLKETLYPRYIVGAAVILPCVWYIARRGGPAPVEMD